MQNLENLVVPGVTGVHPDANAHFLEAEDVAARCGLLVSEADRTRFRAFVKLDAFAYHYATRKRLAAAGAFSQWLYFLDDSYDDHPEFGHDLQKVECKMLRCYEVLCTGKLPKAPTAFERFTAHVRESLAEHAPPDFWGRFLGHSWEYLVQGSLRSMRLWATGVSLNLTEYLHHRGRDSAMFPVLDCTLIAADSELPLEMLLEPAVMKMIRHTAMHVALLNDIFSYQKEVLERTYPCNLIHVLKVERELEEAIAFDAAIEVVNDEAKQFLAAWQSLDPRISTNSAFRAYANGLQSWMRGHYDFSLRSRRFRSPVSPFAELRRSRTISVEMPSLNSTTDAPK